MFKLARRILFAFALSIGLASIGVKGNGAILQTMFAVLGIIFSISMSLLVSFNLSNILNDKIRMKLRNEIKHLRNMLLADFCFSTLVLVVALIWDKDHYRYTYNLKYDMTIDISLTAIFLLILSLFYEGYNFRKMHKLHTEIEDAIVKEEVKKSGG